MTINEIQDEIIEEFADIDDWMDRYAYIIDMGNTLPPMPEEYKTPQYIIEGCQSRAWSACRYNTRRTDTLYSRQRRHNCQRDNQHAPQGAQRPFPAEIADADLYFIDKIGLAENLSPTRSNGLAALVKQMKLYAIAYKAKLENEGK